MSAEPVVEATGTAPSPSWRPVWRDRFAGLTAVAGLLIAAAGLVDPARTLAPLVGAVAALAGIALAPRRRRARLAPLAVLAVAYGVGARTEPEFRGDSVSYFVYLRSAVFDFDLDFANEWEHWGYAELPVTETGLRRNVQSIGPAILWSPFYLAAHGYVASNVGAARYRTDGYGFPYRRAAAFGTITAVVLGAFLLARTLAARVGPTTAAWAVAATCLASPVVYYAFVVPTMAHGPAFAAMCALVAAWHRVEARPTRRAWLILGLTLGLVTLMRWQALVAVLLVAPLAIRQVMRREARPAWIVLAALVSFAAFSPQLLVWRVLFGRWITLPQGSGFMDWSSPHLWDTLISANHGLFTWTPLLALAFSGLVAGVRRAPLFAAGSLLVFAASAWVNGGVADWAASDAYGARRFDLVFPLLAAGLGWFLAGSIRLLVRRPLVAPAALLCVFVLWNVSFVSIFRRGQYPEAAPFDRVARDQARQARSTAENVLGTLLGPAGRGLAYRMLSAEYFYSHYNRDGAVRPAAPNADERYLIRGWANRARIPGHAEFRWALYPEACVRVPLEEPFDLKLVVEAFAPAKTQPQTMTLLINDVVIGASDLGIDWVEIPFEVPAIRLVSGENRVCLRFSSALPGETGVQVAAGVGRIQLP